MNRTKPPKIHHDTFHPNNSHLPFLLVDTIVISYLIFFYFIDKINESINANSFCSYDSLYTYEAF